MTRLLNLSEFTTAADELKFECIEPNKITMEELNTASNLFAVNVTAIG